VPTDTFNEPDAQIDTWEPSLPRAVPPRPSASGRVLIYYSDHDGRRSRRSQYVVEVDSVLAAEYIRRALSLFGLVNMPDACLFGAVIHGIGSEGGTMAVHLRSRYSW
jgi:hypothetical protein